MFVRSSARITARRPAILALAALFLCSLSAVASTDVRKYVVTELGPEVDGIAIDNRCEVACWRRQGNDGYRSFVWRDGALARLKPIPLPHSEHVIARDLGENGHLVGNCNDHLWMWNGGAPIPLFPSQSYDKVAVNGLGHVVGSSLDDDVPVLWRDGVLLSMNSLGPSYYPVAINDSDQVVLESYGERDAFLWESEEDAIHIQPLPGDLYVNARDISNEGEIVGYSWKTEPRATVWRDCVPGELPHLPSSTWDEAHAVNDGGTIAGDSSLGACVWQSGQVFALTLVNSKCRVDRIVDINDHGVILARLLREDLTTSVTAILSPQVEVSIDVRPGTDLNEVFPRAKGYTQVAILTTTDFDASAIDTSTTIFAGATARGGSIADADGDGDLDMLLSFSNSKLKLAAEDYQAALTGFTIDHVAITGTDRVTVRGVRPAPIPKRLRYSSRVLASGLDVGYVAGINEAGQVSAMGWDSAFICGPDGTVEFLSSGASNYATSVSSVNDSGLVAASYDGEAGPCAWVFGGSIEPEVLGPFPGAYSIDVCDLNNSGTIVGDYSSPGFTGAFRSRVNGRITPLRPLRGYFTSIATSVNENGIVVGYSVSSYTTQACYWDKAGLPHSLGHTNTLGTCAEAINDRGTVVGEASAEIGTHPFVWTHSRGFFFIGQMRDGYATDINNQGLVVGVADVLYEDGKPFAWTEETGLVILPYAEQAWPYAVNDRGVIAGCTADQVIVWEPTPPSPVTIDILPGVSPNTINLKAKGTVPVAIITTADFDADIVNGPMSTFAGARPAYWDIRDVDGDGDKDLLLLFEIKQLELTTASTSATLTAVTKDDHEVSGTDTVNVMRK